MDILYGAEVVVPSRVVPKLHDLADALGVSVDLPFRTLSEEGVVTETEDPLASPPPLCCWHCNVTFQDMAQLKSHVKVHQGERFKKKQHRCQQCKKVSTTIRVIIV